MSPYLFGIRSLRIMVLIAVLLPVALSGQDNNAADRFDKSMFKPGYDIPAGVLHGTWDFDEWPGVDHDVVYKRGFMYNSFPNEKIKIDYALSSFDKDDYQGYLKTPAELVKHGFVDMSKLLFNGRKRVLIGVFAHPDDEVLLAGGLFAMAAANGWNVHVYLISNGADGSIGKSEIQSQKLGGYNAYGVTPEGKTLVQTDSAGLMKLDIINKYAKVLGIEVSVIKVNLVVDGKTIVQLGEAEGTDYNRTFGMGSDAREEIRKAIEKIITTQNPTMVFTHGSDGEYGNYMHKLIHDIVQAVASDRSGSFSTSYFTCFPEYNYHDHISHFLDLGSSGGKYQNIKWNALRAITFLYKDGTDYDKPWDPNDDLMDGAFVKDYGYSPLDGMPPRYEFFQKLDL